LVLAAFAKKLNELSLVLVNSYAPVFVI